MRSDEVLVAGDHSRTPNPNSESNAAPGVGASVRASRLGPSFSILGISLWLVTIASYFLLKPPIPLPESEEGQVDRDAAIRLLITLIVTGLGIFASAIFAAIGLFLSVSKSRQQPGPRARRGIILGWIGIGALGLVIAEILRIAFQF